MSRNEKMKFIRLIEGSDLSVSEDYSKEHLELKIIQYIPIKLVGTASSILLTKDNFACIC